MYMDLNVPIPNLGSLSDQSKKGKGKQPAQPAAVSFTAAQISALEARLDILEHLGYSVLALNQTVNKKIDPKTHRNALDVLLPKLRKRAGIVLLKRLTIVLDEESEKGFGLTNANASLFSSYDLIALVPTTLTTLSLACLTHSAPSPLTAHIIALPLTLPRLPFHLKHTFVRTALRNGAVFEISYAGALGGEGDVALANAGAAESGAGAKRNWWAAAREVVRVTKGKGIIVSGGTGSAAEVRAPKDAGNLITLLGLPQNVAHDASTTAPKSLLARAKTRKTYRAVFSEPEVVIPVSSTAPREADAVSDAPLEAQNTLPTVTTLATEAAPQGLKRRRGEEAIGAAPETEGDPAPLREGAVDGADYARVNKKKKKDKKERV